MSYSVCSVDDFKKIKVGQELQINARYENLRRENGELMEFVAKKDDVVVVKKILSEAEALVSFYEDTVPLPGSREFYGDFVVTPNHIQKL